jgi:uncharacterized protein YbjT (DUF2867 family)
MKVILFGATGMVGQGVMRECLLDPDVTHVLSIGRSETRLRHAKLRDLVHKDLSDLSTIEAELAGYDACFFCLGVSSAGMSEADYTRITFDYTLAAAQALLKRSPSSVFVFVSGGGSTEQGRSMWARVKGRAENALLLMPFKAVYIFRPAFIQPLNGEVSKTASYRWLYRGLAPFVPILKAIMPKYVTTTENVGRAMLRIVKHGSPKHVLENADIDALGRQAVTASV